MSKAFNRLQSRMVRFYVSEPYSNTEETRAQYILIFVCREMQRRFHSSLKSLFMAPAALPIQEVISASMEPSAEMIEPRYVNEGTNSTSSPSMFIGVVIAEDVEIIMALVSPTDRHVTSQLWLLICLRCAIQMTGLQRRARIAQCHRRSPCR